jgi:PAS domain S-box-containing protein
MIDKNQSESTKFTSKNHIAHILATLPDALIIVDYNATILYANERARDKIGSTNNEVVGQTLWQCAPTLVSTSLYSALCRAAHTQEPIQVEYLSAATNNWLNVHISPTAEGCMLYFHELKEQAGQTLRQEMLRQSEQLRHMVPDSLGLGSAILTPEGIVLDINRFPLEYTQLRAEDVVGKPFADMPWWSFSAAVQQQVRAAIAQAANGEYVRLNTKANPRPELYQDLDMIISPYIVDEQVEYLIFSADDITKRKRIEEEIHGLIESIPHFVWIAQPDGTSVYLNQRWYDYTKSTPAQTHGDGWSQCIHPDDRQNSLTMWHTAIHLEEPHEEECRIRNGATGAYRWFLVRAVPIKNEQGKMLRWVGTITDIDEQKQLDARFKALFESNIVGVSIADSQGQIYESNAEYLRITGYTREELRAGLMRWDTITPPEFQVRDKEALQEFSKKGAMPPYEKEYIRRDGSRVAVAIGWAKIEDKHISFALDITAQKELEKRKDDFISIASHELKTPLTALRMLIQVLNRRMKREGNKQFERDLARMETQAIIMKRLINDLLDVSKIQTGKFSYNDAPFDPDALVREVVYTQQQTTSTHTLNVHGTLPYSMIGDKQRIAQVLTNLLSNAIKYSPHADTVEIAVSASDEGALVKVCDHGVGIPKKLQRDIFERFNRGSYGTSERAFPGLGMGLYIANTIVTHYGGKITVESVEGQDTMFTVSLPLPHA